MSERLIILDDCYNANPVSMKASIDVLNMAIGRKVAVLGDMGELGNREQELHYEVGEYAAKQGIDLVCGIGSLSRSLAKGAENACSGAQSIWFETNEEFIKASGNLLKNGDNILVKASHSMCFPEIVDALKNF